MSKFTLALVALVAFVGFGHTTVSAEEMATSGPMMVSATVPGDLMAGGHFSKWIVLPASGDVTIKIKQTSGTCLAGGIPSVQKGHMTSGGTLYAIVRQGHEVYGPSDETGECMHMLVVAPKMAGPATIELSNYSAQNVDVEVSISGATAGEAMATDGAMMAPAAAAPAMADASLPKVPNTGRATA
ncbi:MAG: hypothetical protein ABI780_03855, partial [Ardenticatenales bacterium]